MVWGIPLKNFGMFREDLERGLYKEKFTNVGAKPYDYVQMFKILVLQRMYHLSDEQTESRFVTGCHSATSSDLPVATRFLMREPCGCSRKS